jgi:crotonobetainyl-CoA:carnitine CoA-transferase CaiB-like acyl-CoA transferase
MRMAATPPSIVSPPPELGEHNELAARWLEGQDHGR